VVDAKNYLQIITSFLILNAIADSIEIGLAAILGMASIPNLHRTAFT